MSSRTSVRMPMTSARARELLVVAALLAVLAGQLALGVTSDGLTNDEILYIAAGHRYLTASDYRLSPTQPPLGKLLAAVALVGMPLQVPQFTRQTKEPEWCYRFVHVENAAGPLIRRARIPTAVLTVLLAALLWLWARAAHGATAALIALALIVFHPSLLAHGHLATTDLPATFAMVLASWAFWRWSRSRSVAWAMPVGLALGLAAATRLTAWVLLPAFTVIALLQGRAATAERKPASFGALALAVLLLVPLVIWATYGFHYAPWPEESVAEAIRPRLGIGGQLISALQSTRLLPEAYLEGARYQMEHGLSGHPAYLLGERSRTGWWHYYLVAFLVKNTPGFLLGVLVAAAGLWKRRQSLRAAVEIHWLVPAVLVFLLASAGRIQVGERYILPVYPYLILLVASSLAALRGPLRAYMVAAALLLHTLPTLSAAPRGYVPYFNLIARLAGGGHHVLLDSNLDWGQDLPRLAAWMRRRGVSEVQLAYHGSDDPDRFGIRHQDLPGIHLYPPHPAARPLSGTVAVSPNLLFGVFPRPRDNPYEPLRARRPDDRAGVFFIYRVNEAGETSR